MSKLIRIGFITLALLASVTTSNAWAQGLTDIIENKDFWTSYEWQEIFEESEFYKLSAWEKSPESIVRSSATRFNSAVDKYTTRGSIDNLNIEQQIIILVDRSQPRTIFSIEYISHSEISDDDYNKLVSWCKERFGRPFHSRVDKIEGDYTSMKEKSVTTWVIGNTIIGIETRPKLNNLNSLETRLSFGQLGKPRTGINKPSDPGSTNAESAKSAPAMITTSNHNQSPIQTSTINVKSTSKNKYMQPPYIWEDGSGVTNVTDDILNVPENKRSIFEVTIQE